MCVLTLLFLLAFVLVCRRFKSWKDSADNGVSRKAVSEELCDGALFSFLLFADLASYRLNVIDRFQTLGYEYLVQTVKVPDTDAQVEIHLIDVAGSDIYKGVRSKFVSFIWGLCFSHLFTVGRNKRDCIGV